MQLLLRQEMPIKHRLSISPDSPTLFTLAGIFDGPLHGLVFSQLPSDADIGLFTNATGSGPRITTRFQLEDIAHRRVWCCLPVSSQSRAGRASLLFLVALNESESGRIDYVPDRSLVDGLYVQVDVVTAREDGRPQLELPRGAVIVAPRDTTVINGDIINCKSPEQSHVSLARLPRDRPCGEFVAHGNRSDDGGIVWIACADIQQQKLVFRTSEQCDFLVTAARAVAGPQRSRPRLLSIVPRTASRARIKNTGLSCALFSRKPVLRSNLLVSIPRVGADQVLFVVRNCTVAADSGLAVYDAASGGWASALNFSQAHINRGLVRYTADAGRHDERLLVYKYLDLSVLARGRPIEPIVLLIQITGPELGALTAWALILDASAAQSVAISTGHLNIEFRTEGVRARVARDVLFCLETAPKFGFLSLGSRRHIVHNFSLADLAAGRISYTRRGAGPGPGELVEEALEFQVRLNQAVLVRKIELPIYIFGSRAPADLIVHQSPTLRRAPSGRYAVTANNLWLSSDLCSSFTFSVVRPPSRGKFVPHIERFTKEDLIEGALNYRPDSARQREDRFIFKTHCRNGSLVFDMVDEFRIELEPAERPPLERESTEQIFIGQDGSQPLLPSILWFENGDPITMVTYTRFCGASTFPGCRCRPDSLQVLDGHRSERASFTGRELERHEVWLRHRGVLEENLCLTVAFHGAFHSLVVVPVSLDNVSPLATPPTQRLALPVHHEHRNTCIFLHLDPAFPLQTDLDRSYLTLHSRPEFGALLSVESGPIALGDIISLGDLLQSKIVYRLDSAFATDGVIEELRFQIESTTSGERRPVRFSITARQDMPVSGPSQMQDVAVVRLDTLVVFRSSDLTPIGSDHLSATGRLTTDKSQIVYQIIQSPRYGSLQYRHGNGIINEIGRFSERDLELGRIFYRSKVVGPSSLSADEESPDLKSGFTDSMSVDDQFIFQLETASYAESRQWTFRIVFSNLLVVLEASPLELYRYSDVSLKALNLQVRQNFYFMNQHVRFNVSLERLILQVLTPPDTGRIFSKKLNRTVRLFLWQDVVHDDVLYQHRGAASDIQDRFELNALLFPRPATLRGYQNNSPILSEPLKVLVHIRGHTSRIRLVKLQTLHSWAASKVMITNEYLQCALQYPPCSGRNCSWPAALDAITYHVTHTTGGFVSRLQDPLTRVLAFSQREIDARSMLFISTANKSNPIAAMFRFQVSLKGHRHFKAISGRQLKIVFHPIRLETGRISTFQVSSLSAHCQPLLDRHLRVFPVSQSRVLPEMEVLFQIAKTPRCGSLMTKVFNGHLQALQFQKFKIKDLFSQKKLQQKLVCFSVSPRCQSRSLQDSLILRPVVSEPYLYEGGLDELNVSISASHVNIFNQGVFFKPLRWVLRENSSLLLGSDWFLAKTKPPPILRQASFRLVRSPRHGILRLKDIPVLEDQVLQMRDLEMGLVSYRALPLTSIDMVVDALELRFLINVSNTVEENQSQNGILWRFSIIPEPRRLEPITILCVKNSVVSINASIFQQRSANVSRLCSKAYFKISKGPTHGRIWLSSQGTRPIRTDRPMVLSCEEIGKGLVHYQNTNPDVDTDLVSLEMVHDDQSQWTILDWPLTIVLIQDAVRLLPGPPISIRQCQDMATINTTHLGLKNDNDVPHHLINVVVKRPPLYGAIVMDLVPVGIFTYLDLAQSRISYRQSDLRHSGDHFELSTTLGARNKHQHGLSYKVLVEIASLVRVRPAMVAIGAKLIISERHIDSASLESCSHGVVLFTLQNPNLKFGEFSKDAALADHAFTNVDLRSNRVIYESYSFFQNDMDHLTSRNPEPVLTEKITLLVSTPNASVSVQPVFLTLTILIRKRPYFDRPFLSSSRNLSSFPLIDSSLSTENVGSQNFIKTYFSMPALLLMFLTLFFILSVIMAIWYCLRFGRGSPQQLIYQFLFLFSKCYRMRNSFAISDIQRTNPPLSTYNNRIFIDSVYDNMQAIERIRMDPNSLSYPLEMETDKLEGSLKSEENKVNFWL